MAARALERWRAHDLQSQRSFYTKTGVLWMFGAEHGFRSASVTALRAEGIPVEELTLREARDRYPQIQFDGVSSVLLEPEGGYLLARRACEHIVERFVAEGGTYRQAAALPVEASGPVRHVAVHGGGYVDADAFVFACGPWLGTLFPDVIGPLIASTRQEVYYFGTPAGDARFAERNLPAWIEVDASEHVFYGIGGNAYRGFKIADDAPGPAFDPTAGDRGTPTSSTLAVTREFVARRFPALAGAPLVGVEVCQYESTPDAHLIIDRHPAGPNLWIVGGGSGHGFKLGPAVGELVADLVLESGDPDPLFRLARLAAARDSDWRAKWS